MNLKVFTREAYLKLKQDLNANRDKYYDDIDWITSYFAESGIDDYVVETSVTVPNISMMYSGSTDADKNSDDLQNVKIVYSNYKDKIAPSDASDPILWTTMCHLDFRDYVVKRWKKNDGNVSVSHRFFATESRNSLLYYNAISRLWWSGYLTYEEDKSNSNPWRLTETLFTAQQIQKDLFDQPYSMNKNVTKGMLRALKRIQDANGNSSTNIFRSCCDSFINHYGAVAVLDYLSSDEIEEMAYSYMKKLLD